MVGQGTTRERESVLGWLSALDFNTVQKTTYARLHQGTGQWLLRDKIFQDWLLGPKSSILWCCGIRRLSLHHQNRGSNVNSGSQQGRARRSLRECRLLQHRLLCENFATRSIKLTLHRSLIVSFLEDNTQRSNAAIAYIYCDYKLSKTLSEIEILRSICRQLAEQLRPLPDHLISFRDKYAGKRSHPSDDEHLILLKTLAQSFETTYVIVDALVSHSTSLSEDAAKTSPLCRMNAMK